MEINIRTSKLTDAIKTIGKSFKTSCEIDCEEAIIVIPPQYGNGTIRGINFRNGLGLFLLEFELKEKLSLNYLLKKPYPLRGLFCQSGRFSYQFENHEIKYDMQPLRSSLSASSDSKDQSLVFPANTPIILTILEIGRKEYIDKVDCDLESIPERLANVFRDYDAEDPFLYQGDYSLSISEIVNTIHFNSYTGLIRKSYLEGKALELFSLIIRQFEDDSNPNVKKVVIRKVDLEKIELAKDVLIHDLSKATTIPELAKRVGLNENKLKRGFKQAFGFTVNQYLISKRLEYSKVLLISGSFSILEVAEKVGYKNVSFFSKKFKEKYGILPKDFVKNSKTAISA